MDYNFRNSTTDESSDTFLNEDNDAFLYNDDAVFLSDDDSQIKVCQLTAAAYLLLADALDIEEEEESKIKRLWIKPYRKTRLQFGETHNLMRELQPNMSDFKNFIRMDKDCFNMILSAIRPDIEKQNTVMRNAISAEEKLAVTLRFLATEESYMELDYNSKLSKSFLSSSIVTVCEAILKHLKNEFLKFPTTKEEWLRIAYEYKYKWQFPHCLGALDGKHIAFRLSKTDAPLFYNYKGFHSLILLGLADAFGKFIFVDVGCNGRISDGGVLQRSNFMYIVQQPDKYLPTKSIVGDSRLLPYVFVADNAFPLLQNMMTPYAFTTTDENKKKYNHRLSRARQTIERAFGILSNRFQIFQKPINLNQDKVKIIVKCCCVLHNFLITRSRWYGEQNICEESQNTTTQQVANERANTKSSRIGESVRTSLTEYFNNEGSI